MNYLAPLSLAAFLAFGLTSGAQALPTDNSEAGMPPYSVVGTDPAEYFYDHCHGRSAGTASEFCGSATGGPSGGLF